MAHLEQWVDGSMPWASMIAVGFLLFVVVVVWQWSMFVMGRGLGGAVAAVLSLWFVLVWVYVFRPEWWRVVDLSQWLRLSWAFGAVVLVANLLWGRVRRRGEEKHRAQGGLRPFRVAEGGKSHLTPDCPSVKRSRAESKVKESEGGGADAERVKSQ